MFPLPTPTLGSIVNAADVQRYTDAQRQLENEVLPPLPPRYRGAPRAWPGGTTSIVLAGDTIPADYLAGNVDTAVQYIYFPHSANMRLTLPEGGAAWANPAAWSRLALVFGDETEIDFTSAAYLSSDRELQVVVPADQRDTVRAAGTVALEIDPPRKCFLFYAPAPHQLRAVEIAPNEIPVMVNNVLVSRPFLRLRAGVPDTPVDNGIATFRWLDTQLVRRINLPSQVPSPV